MDLVPSPQSVASRIVALVRNGWPDTDGELAAFLAQYQLTEVGPIDEREPGHRRTSYRTAEWGQLEWTLSTWQDQLFSVRR